MLNLNSNTKVQLTSDFKVGQQAFVKVKFFKTTQPSAKLTEKFLEPFNIIAQAGSNFITLQLLDTICRVHPVFHISMLEPAIPDKISNRVQSPLPPVNVQGELKYEIAEILDSKIKCQHSCKSLYLVCWLGYEGTNKEYSWLPAPELDNAQDLISKFHSTYPDKPGLLSDI